MANDKTNINELVTDDEDTTAELEALTTKHFRTSEDEVLLESAERTDDFEPPSGESNATINELKSNLRSSSEKIDRLQFDIEQFRSRWHGLEAEIKARQEITDKLNRELEQARESIERRDERLSKREAAIEALNSEIRGRDEEYEQLQSTVTELEGLVEELRSQLDADRGDEMLRDRELLQRQEGQIASMDAEIQKLRIHIDQSERYADSLRRQLKDRREVAEQAAGGREYLETRLQEASARIVELEMELKANDMARAALEEEKAALHSKHAEEIRTIRFELGAAQETVAQQELVAEQLASDLVDTRGYRAELEKMLCRTEESRQERIQELEAQNAKLITELEESAEKLASKNEAINCLLAELANKTKQIESIVEIEDVIQEIDGRMSARIAEQSAPDRDRVTRLLIGTLEGQELRFPLFKDRLTIGRTAHNDIQLNAPYVSRRHAVVVTDHAATRVIDWGSKNGVFVNGVRVTEHFLESGAEFRYEERPKRDA